MKKIRKVFNMKNEEKYLVLLLISIILPMIITILYYDIII